LQNSIIVFIEEKKVSNFLSILVEVLKTTLPIFIVIAIGYFIKIGKILNEEATEGLNKLAYNIGIPVIIFTSLIKYKISEIFSFKLILLFYVIFILFIFVVFLAYYFTKLDKKIKGAAIVSSYRCNSAFVGFPVLLSAFGTLAVAKAGIMVAFLAPLTIFSTVLIFKFFDLNAAGVSKKKLLIGLMRDPLILAAISGIIISYFGIDLPVIIDSVLDMFSGMAIAIALISIGASFKFIHIKENIKLILIASLSNLVLLPSLGLILSSFVFKISDIDRNIICILLATPLAVSAFIMGKEHGSDSNLISSVLIISTIVSAFTMSGWLIILKLI
jgi:malate permease and related proteins